MKNKKYLTSIIFLSLAVIMLSLIVVKQVSAFTENKNKNVFLENISELYDYIKEDYVDVPDEKLLYEGAMKGMLEALGDPHSTYLSKREIDELSKNTTRGEYGGIGIYINKLPPKSLNKNSLPTDGYITIIAPFEGSVGYREGLHAGDFITHVNGESVIPMTSDEAVSKMTGKPGTDVTLTILRGDSLVFDVVITREVIQVPSEKHSMIGDIGYLKIINWTGHSPERIKEVLEGFNKEKYKGLIIDLRSNPGGLLSSAVDITDYFLSEGTIVSTKGRTEDSKMSYDASESETIVPEDMPVVIIIDEGSASASEIFAGALKDTKRATIVGETSFGKGSVQTVYPFYKTGDAMKLTIAKYYTPSGVNIDKVGIKPDVEVKEPELTEEEIKDLIEIYSDRLISKFVKDNPKPSNKDISNFSEELKSKGISINSRSLKKMIKNEQYRKMDFPPVYDLEYDLQLREAVSIIKKDYNKK